MIDRWIELTNLLEREGFECFMEGTPSCPVLYHRSETGMVVGVDMETVVAYLDRGDDEMPLDLLYLEHGGDATVIVNTVRTLARMTVCTDVKTLVG